MQSIDFKHEMMFWIYLISFLYLCCVAHLSNYDRVFRIIIEDTVVEMYCRDGQHSHAMYKWFNVRWLMSEVFRDNLNDHLHISHLFHEIRKELGDAYGLTDAQRESCAALLNELEVNLMREFRLVGVNEIQILVTPRMFHQAITHVLEINGG